MTPVAIILGILKSPITWIAAGLVSLGLAYWYVNDSAYNRGQAELIRKQTQELADRRKAIEKRADENRVKTPAEINEEFRKRCLRDGGTPETCG